MYITAIAEKYVKELKNMVQIILGVDGMMCSMCEAHVNEAVQMVMDVEKVTSSHSKNQIVIIAENEPNPEKLKAAINSTGYKMTSYECKPYKKKFFFGK
ncbi:MAG: cation transporter [Clostridiales bacterium]|nr:cation transporter [Clostridiales bacterium]